MVEARSKYLIHPYFDFWVLGGASIFLGLAHSLVEI